MKVIDFNEVWERYKIKYVRDGEVSWEEFWALNNVSFSADKGEAVGIIGKNGAGKSTILKLIIGMMKPDKGKVSVEGRVSALMELGAGFNPEFTGRENIFYNAQVYGMSTNELDKKINEIIKFADLGKFIDAPIQYYSQGMYARLAFSLAIHVDPDILLVDDILAVGDESFQRKCRDKIFNLKKQDKTIILVSHDMNTIERLCDKVIFLNEGRIVNIDKPLKVISSYLEKIGKEKGIAILNSENIRVAFNNGRVFISYKDTPLGKNNNSYLAFWDEKENAWISSYDFEWEVLERNDSCITLQGSFKKEEILIRGKIELIENELRFDINIERSDGLEIPGLHWDLVISEDYNKYFFSNDYFSFPALSSRTEWQEIFRIKESNHIGFATENPDFPYLTVQKSTEDTIKIFNTGYDTEKRVISVWSDSKRIKFGLNFFKDDNIFEEHSASLSKDFEQAVQRQKDQLFQQYSINSGALVLFADPETKSIHLYNNGKQLTKSSGIECSFKYKGKLLNTFYSSGFVPSRDKNRLHIDIYWQAVSLRQGWDFYFKDNTLYWDAVQHKDSEEKLEDFKIGLALSHKYRHFFCGFQEQGFPDEFTIWQDMKLKQPFSSLCGVRKTSDLPALALGNIEGAHFIIQNSDSLLKCRIVQLRLNDDVANGGEFKISQKIYICEDEMPIIQYIQAELQKQKDFLFQQYSINSGPLRLFVDPQTKSIHLYYKDQQITKASGIESSFKYNGIFLNTFYSSNFVPTKDGESLFIDILWQEVSLKQRWKFYFSDETLYWDVLQHKPSGEVIEDFKMGLMLSHNYRRFFCAFQENDFPEEFTIWQDIELKDPFSELCGVRGIDNLPALAIENINNCRFIVQNGDSLVKCRTLQVMLNNEAVNVDEFKISQKISVYEDEMPIIRYIQTKLQKHKDLIFQQYSINSGPLRLFVDPLTKSIHLYHNDHEITGANGLFSGLKVDLEDYILSFCKDWEIGKLDDNTLRLIMRQAKTPQQEIFIFKISNGEIFIKSEINASNSFHIPEYYLKAEFNEDYKKWSTYYGEGAFSDEERYINTIIPARLKENKIDRIILKPDSVDLPVLNISCSFNPSRRILSLHKRTDKDRDIVCLQYQYSFFEDESSFESENSYTIFECHIETGEKVSKEQKRLLSSIQLKSGNLGFLFEMGLGKLFWKGKEMTNGLGVYSSMRSKGIWYDSSQAIWRIEDKTESRLVMYGKWLFLPVYQKWYIETRGNKILWSIDTEIFEDTKLEIEQVNIMAVESYDEWILSNGLKGRFEKFCTTDYDILPFRYCYLLLKDPIIKISQRDLPSLSFKCMHGDDFKVLVENSDCFYKSRMMQYQKITDKISSKKYKFFKGEIEIQED